MSFKTTRLETVALLLLLSVTIFFSTYKLTESPPVWYDEGFYLQSAIQVSKTGEQALQIAPDETVSVSHVTVGYPVIYPLAAVFLYSGTSLLSARLLMAFFILALIALTYCYLRKRFGMYNALLGATLVATFPILYGNGKSVLGEVPGLFFLMLFFFFVDRLENRKYKMSIHYFLCGICAGLVVATKPIFILLLPALAIAAFITRKERISHWMAQFSGCAGFLAAMAVWFATQFKAGDSFTSVFSYYANPYAYGNLTSIILENISRFFTESTPLYALVLFMVWSLSLIIRWHQKEKISFIEIVAFSFSLLIFGAYLRTPGWYRYFFPAQVLSLLYFPAAMQIVLKKFLLFIHSSSAIKFPRWGGGAIVVLFVFVHLYQLGFSSWVAEHYESTRTSDLTAYFHTMPSSTLFYLYDVPEAVIFLPNQNYFQYIKPVNGTLQIGRETLDKLYAGVPDVVIVRPEDAEKEILQLSAYTTIRDIGGYRVLQKVSP